MTVAVRANVNIHNEACPDDINLPKYNTTGTSPLIQLPPAETVVTTQPQNDDVIPFRIHSSWNESTYIIICSMILCVACFICGSPVTSVCFIPAIVFSSRVSYTTGMSTNQNNFFFFLQIDYYYELRMFKEAKENAYGFLCAGVVSGFLLLMVAIVLKLVVYTD